MDTYIISKLIVKERVTLTSLYIQLVRLLAYFRGTSSRLWLRGSRTLLNEFEIKPQ